MKQRKGLNEVNRAPLSYGKTSGGLKHICNQNFQRTEEIWLGNRNKDRTLSKFDENYQNMDLGSSKSQVQET